MKNKNKFTEKFDVEMYRQKILFLLRNDKEKIAKNIMKEIAREEYIAKNDMNGLYEFFSPIYDELFYDLMFKNINITISTKELLENLALPIFKMEESRKEEVIGKID